MDIDQGADQLQLTFYLVISNWFFKYVPDIAMTLKKDQCTESNYGSM